MSGSGSGRVGSGGVLGGIGGCGASGPIGISGTSGGFISANMPLASPHTHRDRKPRRPDRTNHRLRRRSARPMIFPPEYETLERAALDALQAERLAALVERLRSANPLYRERLHASATPRAPEDL